jgi:hypothetical protein
VNKEQNVGSVLMLLGVLSIAIGVRYFLLALYFVGAVFIIAASAMLLRKRRAGNSPNRSDRTPRSPR